jgi:hypothetical protein
VFGTDTGEAIGLAIIVDIAFPDTTRINMEATTMIRVSATLFAGV